MFIRYFVEIPRPAAAVQAEVLDSPERWAASSAEGAETAGQTLMADVGLGTKAHRLSRSVDLQFGEPIRFPSRAVLPMTWKASRLGGLFPQLDADIEVAPLGPARTQLAINGRYTVPLGSVGWAMDRVLLHRIAEATVKDFLDRAAQTLLNAVPPTE